MIVYPNAKINIGLNVLKKREDGYHDISSIFYPIKSTFDILEIIPSDVFSFFSTGIFIPERLDICTKAYNLLQEEFGIKPVNIHLHKQIPIGAGLGGGSADGAFTLVALNKLFDLRLSVHQLEEYALQLGADCPFFIDNTPKYVSGIGDKMISVHLDLADYKIQVVFSGLHISTAEAYAEIRPTSPKISLIDLVSKPLEFWKGRVKNDFEISAFTKHKKLRIIKEKLYTDGALYASMSGSGSALYGVFEK